MSNPTPTIKNYLSYLGETSLVREISLFLHILYLLVAEFDKQIEWLHDCNVDPDLKEHHP